MNKPKRTIIKTIFLSGLALLAIINISYGQTKADKIDKLMNAFAEYGAFNGSVLVAHEGEVIYKKGFGFANIEWDIPNQPNTKHRLGSITKLFTAMLIVKLASENKLKLEAPISTYLTDYPKTNGDLVTVQHLMDHTSGIPNYTDIRGFMRTVHNPYSHEEMMGFFADSTLQFTPGEKYSYSNSGYYILGLIIEKVTGQSYEQVLQDKILSPIKMNNTGYDHHRTVLKNRATGYNRERNHRYFVNADYINMSIPYAAGSMYSTVEDLFLWDQALYTEELLSQKDMEIFLDPEEDFWEMSIGNTNDVVRATGHTGGVNGFYTQFTRVPANKSLIVLLSNTGRTSLSEMTVSILGILHDKSYDFPKNSIATSLFDVIENEGVEVALTHYNAIKDSEHSYLKEEEMNEVGYNLLFSNRVKEAAFILKLNVEAFPASFNVYDSYGEVLLALGKEEEAIKNYKKSVALNPDNENGIKMLKEIEKEDLALLETDSTWGKEIFLFPISFAPALNYQGFEDARFPKGWGKIESDEFWSYAFAWSIGQNTELGEAELKDNLQIYFDGLMNVVNKDKELVVPPTSVLLHKRKAIGDSTRYEGEVHVYDAFHTKKNMTLHVTIEQGYCEKNKKSITLFRFSPKEFGSEIWLKLNQVKLRGDVCDL